MRKLVSLGLSAALAFPAAAWGGHCPPPRTNLPTPSVSAEAFLGFSGANMHFDYFSYGSAVGGAPPGWGEQPKGFGSDWGAAKLRDWLNLCADNGMTGVRIMSVFGDGRNLFDAAGNFAPDEALTARDLDAFLRITDEVERARGVSFRVIFTLFDFRLADGELIGGLGEHPEVFDPLDPRRRQLLRFFRETFFPRLYGPGNGDLPLVRDGRVVWQLVNEFTSFKPPLNGRSEDEALADPAYRMARARLHERARRFMRDLRAAVKAGRPGALVGMSDLGARNTIARWQGEGYDLIDYHSHPDFPDLNGDVGTSLRNVGWDGVQPIIEGEAYIPGWRTADRQAHLERMRASFNRGSRGVLFWWDGWYRFDPPVYAGVAPADLAFSPRADLAVTAISGPVRAESGVPAVFRVKVVNEGDLDSGWSKLKLQVRPPFGNGFELETQDVPPLAPGAHFLSAPVAWTPDAGYHWFTAEADNWLQIEEYDEDNNNAFRKFSAFPR